MVGFWIGSYASPRHLKTGPFENRTFLSGFLAYFKIKQSRLEVKKTSVWFSNGPTIRKLDKTGQNVRFSNDKNKMVAKPIRKPETQKCSKNDHLNTRRSGIWWFTVICNHISPFLCDITDECPLSSTWLG
jgi:hypothetical protein